MKKILSVAIVLLMVFAMCSTSYAFHWPKDGADGADGIDGVDGQDGSDGVDGSNGADGRNEYRNNEAGLGVDVILLDQCDEFGTGRINNISLLKQIKTEYRRDFNSGEPIHKGYLVGVIKLWNK